MPEKKKVEGFDLEAVYDAEIAPLMEQIIEVCRRVEMPMLASFCYGRDDEETAGPDGQDHLCTTCLPFDRCPDPLNRAYHAIMRGSDPGLMAFTIREGEGHAS